MAEIIVPAADRREKVAFVARFVMSAYPGHELVVTIGKHVKERSNPQNKALFGVAYPPLMEHIGLQGGDEKEELHHTFCGMFWGWTDYQIMGQERRRPRRTTTVGEDGKKDIISTEDFMKFYAFVQKEAAEIGVVIPDPDPLWFVKTDKKTRKEKA